MHATLYGITKDIKSFMIQGVECRMQDAQKCKRLSPPTVGHPEAPLHIPGNTQVSHSSTLKGWWQFTLKTIGTNLMSVQWTITVRHQAMEILRGERGKKHSSSRFWLLCFCSCILFLLEQVLGPFSFVIFLSRQIKGPGDTKWHAKSDTGKEMCKRW